MVYLVFLFAFNLHWLWRWRQKPVDFIASVRRKMVDVEHVVQFASASFLAWCRLVSLQSAAGM